MKKEDGMNNEQKYTYNPDKTYNLQGEYSNICKQCNKQHTLFTQSDEYPEYYTCVILKCDCEHLIVFELPVN